MKKLLFTLFSLSALLSPFAKAMEDRPAQAIEEEAQVPILSPEEAVERLCQAVAEGRMITVRKLIQAGVDIDGIHANRTALSIAIEFKNTEIMELLLNAGAQVNITTPEGFTCLHYAARDGNLKAVTLLLKHKADIHAQATAQAENFQGITALHQAANKGHNLVVDCLLKAGAHCTALGAGATPLIHAVRHGRIETATTLLTSIPPTEYTAIRNCFTGLLSLNRIQPLHPALCKDIRRLLTQTTIELFSNEQEQRMREQIAMPIIVNNQNHPDAAQNMAYAVHLDQPTENSEAMYHLLDLSNAPNKAMLLKKVKANIGRILLSKSDDELNIEGF